MKTNNQRIAVYYIVALLAVILLSGGISRMTLKQEPIIIEQAGSEMRDGEAGTPSSVFGWILIGIVVFGILGIVYLIITGNFRQIIRAIVAMALWLVAWRLIGPSLLRPRGSMVEFPKPMAADFPSIPTTDAALARPSDWIIILVGFVICSLIPAAGFWLWRYLKKRSTPLEMVAREAQKTLDDLYAGVDVKEGVIRCYLGMIKALAKYYDCRRDRAMTPREFEDYLRQAGFMSSDIERLTRLFEKVRYGCRNPGETEEREAVACLESIIRFGEESK
ncbi:MAG: DUF4129 domain-containing protein [Proteobacteria bacterium]|nr:DUF4129 domain-containing protein [Pseudomonadota bacterium]